MSFEPRFHPAALKEWHALDATIREQFKNKLTERLEHPRVPAAKLAGHPDRYKIKPKAAGQRLVYEVRDNEIVIVVIAVGRRDRNAASRIAAKR